MFGIVKLFQQVANGCSNYLAEYQDSFMRGKLQALIHEKCARAESVQMADCIFVFNQGILEESGMHEELMEKGGLYKTAFMSQAQWYYDRE